MGIETFVGSQSIDITILRLLLISVACGIIFLLGRLLGFIPSFVCGNEEEYIESDKNIIQSKEDKPLSVILKDNNVDSSRIVEYEGEELQKFEFRPETWEQFIGQKQAKERAETVIKKAKKGIKAHFLVDGIKGHGKTTFVELVGKELDAHIIKRVGKQVNEDNLVDIINEINQSEKEFVLLFIDELDSLDWKVIKVLNPIIESFELSGKKIKPFIFAGATINKHILLKNNPDTLDRIPTHIKFVRYEMNDLVTILKQYQKQLYEGENISQDVFESIGRNSKFNPRTGISLLSDYVVEYDMEKILRNWQVVKDGLNNIDIKVLKVLEASKRPVGANALATKCGLSEKEYITEIEPFLVEFDYVNRMPSRVLSEKGQKFLNKLKEKANES